MASLQRRLSHSTGRSSIPDEDPLLRAGELMRLPKGPSHVKRIGHGVLMTPKFGETVAWFRDTAGLSSARTTSMPASRAI